jgi:hypothetical protein
MAWSCWTRTVSACSRELPRNRTVRASRVCGSPGQGDYAVDKVNIPEVGNCWVADGDVALARDGSCPCVVRQRLDLFDSRLLASLCMRPATEAEALALFAPADPCENVTSPEGGEVVPEPVSKGKRVGA